MLLRYRGAISSLYWEQCRLTLLSWLFKSKSNDRPSLSSHPRSSRGDAFELLGRGSAWLSLPDSPHPSFSRLFELRIDLGITIKERDRRREWVVEGGSRRPCRIKLKNCLS